ncbi:inverse autotransporter beta domain-containing protein, partial [Lelliottia amnigena]
MKGTILRKAALAQLIIQSLSSTVMPLSIAFSAPASGEKTQSLSLGSPAPSSEGEMWVAQGMVKGAEIANGASPAEMATQYALGQVNSAASSGAQNWLSQYGNARVQLGIDKDFTLQESGADLLAPLYDDKKSNLLFSQIGIRNNDDRNTLNIGLGYRYFTDAWMYGVNTFYDYDMTGENRRVGLGVEAWKDYLKLSANGYFGLTDWHQSRDFRDYDERPADGFDITSEMYHPSYPQLGAKLRYEQYFGDEVALFGEDERQKNPYAFTAGLSYTPFPLLSASLDQKMGSGGKNDTQIGIGLTWSPGVPLSSLLDPDAVSAMRSLQGERYDFVDRNNSIVLEYKKQEIIKFRLDDIHSGPEKTTIPVDYKIKAKYAPAMLEWVVPPSFTAGGGQVISAGDGSYSLMLPAYNSARSLNTYTLSAVARDAKGNQSSEETTLVEVLPGGPSVAAKISGTDLNTGSVLHGEYTWTPNGVGPDKSLYAWGAKGATSGSVANGSVVPASGKTGDYTITGADAGKYIELSVLASDGKVKGNTSTVDTSMVSGGTGSCPAGNDACVDITNPGTENPGQVQTGTPSVAAKISGTDLNTGSVLHGEYTWTPNGVGPDKSLYAWGAKGATS